MTTSAAAFSPDYAVAPGELLLDVLRSLDMTQADLAARTGLSAKHVNQIVKGLASISAETASQLEFATDVSAEIWASLDARYQASHARTRYRKKLEASIDWLDQFNLRELRDRSIVESTERSPRTVEALLKYFGISDRDGWARVWQPSITSFRRSPAFRPKETATTLWLRAGQRAASRVETRPYDQRALVGALPELRRLTAKEPKEALAQLRATTADFGVAVVYIDEFDGCRASGATWWASPSKAVVMLSNRGKREDRLWFSLFHELGHVLLHAKRDTFLDQNRADDPNGEAPPWDDPAPASGFIDDGSRDSQLELEADSFASTALIPAEFEPAIKSLRSRNAVLDLASSIGVSPGVVAGRYQYETGQYRKYNDLRRPVPHEIFVEPV